jgi:hypothetical protein
VAGFKSESVAGLRRNSHSRTHSGPFEPISEPDSLRRGAGKNAALMQFTNRRWLNPNSRALDVRIVRSIDRCEEADLGDSAMTPNLREDAHALRAPGPSREPFPIARTAIGEASGAPRASRERCPPAKPVGQRTSHRPPRIISLSILSKHRARSVNKVCREKFNADVDASRGRLPGHALFHYKQHRQHDHRAQKGLGVGDSDSDIEATR